MDEPRPEDEEVRRVLESAARYFPAARLSMQDLISSFAGLRPLVGAGSGATKELSRREEIIESESGLISIIGGKLTTWRRMAERVTDRAVSRLGPASEARPSVTASLRLAASDRLPADEAKEAAQAAEEFGLPVATVEHLMRSYGGNYRTVLEISRETKELRRPLVEGLPRIEAEVIYAARFEMATGAEDFLSRRSRIRLVARDGGRQCAARVADLIEREQAGRK